MPTRTGHPTGSHPSTCDATRTTTSTTRTPWSSCSRPLDARPDLVVSQLNAPDTAAHVHGPDSEGALAAYRETDARLAILREHLDWDDTVWFVVSDHDQETVVDRAPVDLRPA